MNIALIIAGGKGQRMKQEIPKQFLNVNDKPIIIYTLEAFQKHPNIDEIGVVCIDGWHDILKAYARQYNITKLKWVIPGGKNGQDSIRNGVHEAAKRYCDKDLLLIHDAIRPLVTEEIISDCIVQCEKYGSAIVTVPCTTAVLKNTNNEGIFSNEIIKREELAMTQTPQAFSIGKLMWAHEEALKKGITNSVASCTMMIELGEKVHFSMGAETNIKLTTQDDLKIFKAMLIARDTL
ncbi:2-C-methyl-D-erythritol 4-phosphate cytidylyltransferase [Clostridium botulinum]|uniref:IspD/TarI family cytidylyltransferase n=1 Tax=Clostridium botulinum TaxID=1491 RepID=UPI0013F94324|nr:IspD/TarI family cytidylyltransferase [Clostridium botulinum]MCS6103226.1 2-C-methyl-D-erythritol 4-phosphate cytidylyltransferase [Clostridium botulinum]MCS6106755.1 2-C-methyl-D-erythritol 4-phosphate cytidylyltransferase [Clostridium botulinum]NFO47508.1 2-C-methyl-D-erythritol 4-phosphate cytidylyltransferase [Clostridium botulinum]NFS10801.1 2-C-methyl-D-erythritol 4-phosphate cytidylyltransferase [Clostridium botulinum]